MKLKKKSTRKINKNPIGNDKIRKKNQFKKKKGGKRLVRMGLVGLVFQILTTTSSRKCG
jgi:hypothetical protein